MGIASDLLKSSLPADAGQSQLVGICQQLLEILARLQSLLDQVLPGHIRLAQQIAESRQVIPEGLLIKVVSHISAPAGIIRL